MRSCLHDRDGSTAVNDDNFAYQAVQATREARRCGDVVLASCPVVRLQYASNIEED